MAILKEGKYLGEHKDGDEYYHAFSPVTIAVNGETINVRAGDYEEELPTDRSYMIKSEDINEAEKVLMSKKEKI